MRKFLSLGILLALASIAGAQTGSIAGTVVDSSGAVMQGAEVTVSNVQTGAVRSASTGSSGAYAVTNLPASSYKIEVKKADFARFLVPNVPLTVDQVLTVNVTLQPGGETQVIQVEGTDISPIDLETSQISNLIEQRQIQSLPLITRNPYQLVLLSPGTSQTDSASGGFSVNGGRDRNNNFLLDGADNNDTSVPGGQGGALNGNPDSTQEFRVITDNFNPEFGRNNGAIIDVITKSGSNAFHGDAYYFGRWNGFGGARDWFNPSTGPNAAPQNPYIRHQFGFSVGGPIIKNRTFFFVNDEFDRFITNLTDQATVPTADFLTGKFNYTYTDSQTGLQHTVPIDLTQTGANNTYGLPFDPTLAAVLAKYPTATNSADGIAGNIFFPSASRQKSYSPVVKIDHKINDRETLSMRYGYNHFFDPNPGFSDILPGFGAYEEKSINQGATGQLTSTLTNSLVNNFIFGWNHIYAAFYISQNTINQLDGPGGTDPLGNGWDYLLDPFSSFGSTTLGGSNGQARKTGTTSFSDSLTWVRGQHTLKFGFDFRNVRESGYDNFDSRRQLTLDPLLAFGFDPKFVNAPNVTNDQSTALIDGANALYGLVIEDFQAQFFDKNKVRQATDDKIYRQHEFDWFAQDAWKIRRNLTLNFGLRYQLNGVPYEENGNASNLFQDPSSYAAGQDVVFNTVGAGTGRKLYNSDYKDIEPRVGFTWDPWSNGKTAIRGGFGIFHDRVFGNLFGNARANPPFQASYDQFPIETVNNAFGTDAFPTQIAEQNPSPIIPDGSTISNLVVFNRHFPNPASNNWNFDIQRELPWNNIVDVAYVGTTGYHIVGQQDGNPPDPALVQQLVAYCSVPNAFDCTAFPNQTDPPSRPTVTGLNLYNGFENGLLPFDAVNNNALLQPNYLTSSLNSNYHALQTKIIHRMSHGLQIQGSYTWSHALDNGVDPLTPAVGARTFPRNSRNLAQSYGNSDNDTRHVGVINYVWDLPIGRGKTNLSKGLVGRALEGIQLTGIFTAQTGHPFNVRSSQDTQRTGISAWGYQVQDPFRPTSADCVNTTQPTIGKVYFTNGCAFTAPPWGSASNNERNQWYGPGFWDWDASVSKIMSITERVKAELRVEGYNVFNHPHFQNPGTDAAANGNLVGSSQFGFLTQTYVQPDGTTSARQLQVALRVSF